MRRFVLLLFPALVALVSAGLLVAARRSETLRARIDRIKDGDWLAPIVSRRVDIAEVPS
jgi:hypothetical protein